MTSAEFTFKGEDDPVPLPSPERRVLTLAQLLVQQAHETFVAAREILRVRLRDLEQGTYAAAVPVIRGGRRVIPCSLRATLRLDDPREFALALTDATPFCSKP